MTVVERLVLPLGLRYAARGLRTFLRELHLWLLHAIGIIKARRYAARKDLKLHIGCGPKVKAGWLNIDMVPQADLRLDLRRPLPIATESCDIAYSEHFMEHLDYPDDVRAFLRECFRVLKPGARISVGVPDCVTPLPWALKDIEIGRTNPPKSEGQPAWCTTPMEQVNFMFRQNYLYWHHEHRFAYDVATLEKCLVLTGFRDVRRRDFDPSIDSADRRDFTIYVDGVK